MPLAAPPRLHSPLSRHLRRARCRARRPAPAVPQVQTAPVAARRPRRPSRPARPRATLGRDGSGWRWGGGGNCGWPAAAATQRVGGVGGAWPRRGRPLRRANVVGCCGGRRGARRPVGRPAWRVATASRTRAGCFFLFFFWRGRGGWSPRHLPGVCRQPPGRARWAGRRAPGICGEKRAERAAAWPVGRVCRQPSPPHAHVSRVSRVIGRTARRGPSTPRPHTGTREVCATQNEHGQRSAMAGTARGGATLAAPLRSRPSRSAAAATSPPAAPTKRENLRRGTVPPRNQSARAARRDRGCGRFQFFCLIHAGSRSRPTPLAAPDRRNHPQMGGKSGAPAPPRPQLNGACRIPAPSRQPGRAASRHTQRAVAAEGPGYPTGRPPRRRHAATDDPSGMLQRRSWGSPRQRAKKGTQKKRPGRGALARALRTWAGGGAAQRRPATRTRRGPDGVERRQPRAARRGRTPCPPVVLPCGPQLHTPKAGAVGVGGDGHRWRPPRESAVGGGRQLPLPTAPRGGARAPAATAARPAASSDRGGGRRRRLSALPPFPRRATPSSGARDGRGGLAPRPRVAPACAPREGRAAAGGRSRHRGRPAAPARRAARGAVTRRLPASAPPASPSRPSQPPLARASARARAPRRARLRAHPPTARHWPRSRSVAAPLVGCAAYIYPSSPCVGERGRHPLAVVGCRPSGRRRRGHPSQRPMAPPSAPPGRAAVTGGAA